MEVLENPAESKAAQNDSPKYGRSSSALQTPLTHATFFEDSITRFTLRTPTRGKFGN